MLMCDLSHEWRLDALILLPPLLFNQQHITNAWLSNYATPEQLTDKAKCSASPVRAAVLGA
jgi:hypothetical protein